MSKKKIQINEKKVKEDLVSVIIPTYNTEKFIGECLDSVINQTYKNYEIIVINDGSTDDTLNILREYEKKYDFIKVIDNTNHGQGYERNLALKQAKGDYVLFLDSDDFIEHVTLEVAVDKIKEDKSDFVVFDWKYYSNKKGTYSYISKENFFNKKYLKGNEILQLLGIVHYFTVNKLYSREFLINNNIMYGEGYIYEDNPFWVEVVVKAKKVSLIHSPLYNVRVNDESTTKTNHKTDKHYKGFIAAIREEMKIINKYPKNNYYDLYVYNLKKFDLYYRKRTPFKLKHRFLHDFIDCMGDAVSLPKMKISNKLLKLSFKYKIFEKKRYCLFFMLYYLLVFKKALRMVYRKFRGYVINFLKKIKNFSNTRESTKLLNLNKKEEILFMGFDYRYTGNSRYLYEEMLRRGYNNLYFVTNNELVDEKRRIVPNSKEFFKKLYSSKVVIFESWIPDKFEKPNNAVWINLWHGTPLKKMLFDSNEEEIITDKPNHKILKYKAIQKMDYLLIDNKNISKYFETSFLMEPEQILAYGYPRVEYLIENKNNKKLKSEIRKKLNVDKNKKIVMYLPTWRDYNYSNDGELDFDYFLDKDKLIEYLDDDNYVIISKDHAYLRKAKDVTMTDIETQELLLVSDVVITDYSSVMYDAFAVDIPVCIIAKDYDKYSKSRGLYPELWEDLRPFVVDNEKDLSSLIKNYKINKEYKDVKEKYGYKSQGDLVKFIDSHLK